MNVLVEVLFLLSSALLVPVITILVAFFAWSLWTLGRFAEEARERARRDAPSLDPALREALEAAPDRGAAGGDDGARRAEDVLDGLERTFARRLERTTVAARVAPMLGLMGTLIPMGPALMGLAGGDVETLAANLVVAFSTTVVGLAASAVLTWVSTVRRRWYDEDLAAQVRLAERALAGLDPVPEPGPRHEQAKEVEHGAARKDAYAPAAAS